MQFKPLPEQTGTLARLAEHDRTLLYAGMGSGKTICSITVACDRLGVSVDRVDVVAPANVVNVWLNEAEKWGYTEVVGEVGSGKPIQVCSINKVHLICDDFDGRRGLVIDELTKWKSSGGAFFKKLRRKLKHYDWRVGLTGTPVHEGLDGLFAMTLLLDDGERFGRRYDAFLRRYFTATDYNQRVWAIRDDAAAKELLGKLDGLLYTANEGKADADNADIYVEDVASSSVARGMSRQLMRDYEAADGDLVADSAAVVSGKLRQLAQGFFYRQDGGATVLDSKRTDAVMRKLDEWGEGCLIISEYTHMLTTLSTALKNRGAIVNMLAGSTPAARRRSLLTQGAAGNLRDEYLLMHPRSGGHGLDGLQFSYSKILFVAPIWSNDSEKQVIGRLARSGQTKPVEVCILAATSTIEERMVDVVGDKEDWATLLKSLAAPV